MAEYTPTTADIRDAVTRPEALHPDAGVAGGEFDRWLASHDEGQQVKGIRRLLDYRPLPRDVRLYIEGYLEACAEDPDVIYGRRVEPQPDAPIHDAYSNPDAAFDEMHHDAIEQHRKAVAVSAALRRADVHVFEDPAGFQIMAERLLSDPTLAISIPDTSTGARPRMVPVFGVENEIVGYRQAPDDAGTS